MNQVIYTHGILINPANVHISMIRRKRVLVTFAPVRGCRVQRLNISLLTKWDRDDGICIGWKNSRESSLDS